MSILEIRCEKVRKVVQVDFNGKPPKTGESKQGFCNNLRCPEVCSGHPIIENPNLGLMRIQRFDKYPSS